MSDDFNDQLGRRGRRAVQAAVAGARDPSSVIVPIKRRGSARGASAEPKADDKAPPTKGRRPRGKKPPVIVNDDNTDVGELNERFALVLAGDKAVVMMQSYNADGRPAPRFLSVESFRTWCANRFALVGEDRVLVAKLWLASRRRRQFEGIAFAPGGEVPPGHFNLWRGWSVTPRLGDCSRFTDHVLDNVCGGNVEHFTWVMGWFAHLFQRPSEKLGTALVLRGPQGVGKTILGKTIGSLVADHYAAVSEPRYVTGRFNSHLLGCLLLHADEGFWAGDREAESKLKDLVTGEHHFIELKGKEPFRVRNLVRLFVTGNPRWVVPAGMEERRFAVFDVGEGCMQDHAYFAAIERQLDDGGREALLSYLLAYDLSGIDLRQIPDTPALGEQKVASFTSEEAWLFERLRAGSLIQGRDAWPEWVACAELFDAYIMHAEKIGIRRRALETQLGTTLRRLIPGVRRREGTWTEKVSGPGGYDTERTRRGYVYDLPTIEECRRTFTERFTGSINWEA